jgi:superkiller protein 3
MNSWLALILTCVVASTYADATLKPSQSVDDLCRQSQELVRAGKYQMALEAAEQALAINRESAEAEYLAGAAALGLNEVSRAEAHFRRALKLAPSHFRALAGLLDAQLRLNRAEQAAVTLAAIDRQLGEHDARRVQIAELLVGRGAYGLAVREFEALNKADPKSYEFSYDLALAYHRAGKDARASTLLQNLLAHKDGAELEDLLGEVEQSRGSANNSVAAFRRAVELDPKNENYLLHFGQALVNRGSLNEAVTVFAAATKDLPHSSQMWMAWGSALYLLGRFRDSAEKLLQAADIAPQDPRVYFLLGRAYGAAGSYRDAIAKQFARHVIETPNDAWAQYFYGKILAERSTQLSSGDLDEAQRHVERALALDGSLAEAHAELGSILDTRGQLDAARRELEQATRLDPNSSIAFYRLAPVY